MAEVLEFDFIPCLSHLFKLGGGLVIITLEKVNVPKLKN